MPKTKIISSIIALVLGLCVVVFTIAYFSINGKHNREGFTFEGDFFNGTATLIGMENPNEVVKIPQTISFLKVKKLGGEEKIGGILFSTTFEGMFEGNSTVKEIMIPEGVEIVGDEAISGCENLERIILPNTLTELEIRNCDKLEKVDIPGSVTSLSLTNCVNLKEINFVDDGTIIKRFCFQGSGLEGIILPSRLEMIPMIAFSVCEQLETVNIPQSVTSIESYAFEWCTSLVSLELPNNIESIGAGAFRECSSLEKIIIYDKCTLIYDDAFNGCDKLTIYGIKGSYVEQYANEHNIPFGELDTTYEPTN